MPNMHLASLLSIILLVLLAAAHPGHDHGKELLSRREFLSNHRNDLNHCTERFETVGIQGRSIETTI